MDLLLRHPILDDVLAEHAFALGNSRVAYQGHAYRVFNVARRLLGSDARDDELAIAAAFHDIGIWTDHTFDYLAPSIDVATRWLDRTGRSDAQQPLGKTIAAIIDDHHRLRRVDTPIVDAFRRADLVDVTRGVLRQGVDRNFLRELTAAFPYEGFHGILLRTAVSWFIRHPLRPLPMLKL